MSLADSNESKEQSTPDRAEALVRRLRSLGVEVKEKRANLYECTLYIHSLNVLCKGYGDSREKALERAVEGFRREIERVVLRSASLWANLNEV